MPIFQDDLDHDEFPRDQLRVQENERKQTVQGLIPIERRGLRRQLSEESIRTELCEGPVPDSPNEKATTPEREHATSDRAELIERLKRGESPTWIPNRHISSRDEYLPGANTGLTATKLESILGRKSPASTPRSPTPGSRPPPSLLPPAQITPERKKDGSGDDEERFREGLSIERPRSALHSGDFTQEGERQSRQQAPAERRASNFPGPSAPWIATSPPRDFAPFQYPGPPRPPSIRADDFRSIPSSLASSFSSSFVYKQPPTSPLVQSESNDDLDLSLPLNSIDISSRLAGPNRRHTVYSAASTPSTPFAFPASRTSTPQRTPSLRRESTVPYQAHQPRRSLNSTPNINLASTSPGSSAFLRPRRPSLNSDTSPLQHASMVGSYEESILRGRMSTTPSKPLDFLAQIGVLGLGKCKASLRCPPHVTLSFPAVFYSYGGTTQGRSRLEEGPSPYVGQIDLENGLPNPEEDVRAKRKIHSRYADKRAAEGDVDMTDADGPAPDVDVRRLARPRKRSGSPKAPPGGSYRIPEKGRIQIIIKNQNKTAVKLFLVPYDLAGMEPGTKTFIRQRSYSAGPIVDNVPGGQEPPPSDRPVLRYLIHLHICCPSKGRFYLYKSIRIVFANRVPDGKEKLKNETTWPEPRFSAYKPIRVMHPPVATSSGPGAMLAAEKAFRRRSSGYSFGVAANMFDPDEAGPPPLPSNSAGPSTSFSFASPNMLPVDPIPFRLPPRVRNLSQTSQSTCTDTTATTVRSPERSMYGGDESSGDDTWSLNKYEKLNKGDVGYGGNAFALGSGSPGTEGLLSQRLKSLGVRGLGSFDSSDEGLPKE